MDAEIVSIVRRELGEPPDRVARVSEGLLHETYELGCDGEEYVLQFSSDATKGREDSSRRGLNCYVALENSEIPVPEVVTETVREFRGREYVLVGKLPGKSGERDISPERVRNAARHLARIHNVWSFEEAGWIRFEDRIPTVYESREGNPKRRLRDEVERSAKTIREGGLEAVASEVESAFDRFEGELPEEFRPVLCHDDYSPDNVLFRGGDVTGILDFDRTYSGHGHRDVAKAANCFWMHDPCADWNVRGKFYEGYRDANELDGSFERCEPLYRVETLAGIVAGLLELGELSEYEKEFYSERIMEAAQRVE